MLQQEQLSLGHNLIRALRGAKRSWWRRAVADAALFAVLVTACATLLTWLRAWFIGDAGPLLESTPLILTRQLLLVAIGAFAIGLIVAALRSPSLLEMARRVDRLLGQEERFSTSYEVLAAGRPGNVVTRALLTDVEARAQGLAVAPVGWRRPDRWLLPAAAATLLVAAMFLVVPVPERLSPTASVGVQEASPQPRDAATEAASLAGMAELLDLVAEQENSDYVRALAASFSDLAERVSTNSVSAAETATLTRELTEHLQAASQEVGGRFSEAVAGAFDTLAPAAMNEFPPAATNPAQTTPAPAAAGVQESLSAPITGGTSSSNEEFYSSINEMVEQFRQDPTAVGVRPPRRATGSDASADNFYGGVLNAETDPNAAVPQQSAALGRADGQAAGSPAGAAERSSDAAGDAAGQGGADFGQGSDTFLDLAVEGGALSPLALNQRDDGEFIEMELVPRANIGDELAAGPGVVPPDFNRADEEPFSSHGIGVRYAEVVSRYFTPGSVPAAR